jgi:hypothetical protein
MSWQRSYPLPPTPRCLEWLFRGGKDVGGLRVVRAALVPLSRPPNDPVPSLPCPLATLSPRYPVPSLPCPLAARILSLPVSLAARIPSLPVSSRYPYPLAPGVPLTTPVT